MAFGKSGDSGPIAYQLRRFTVKTPFQLVSIAPNSVCYFRDIELLTPSVGGTVLKSIAENISPLRQPPLPFPR